MPLGEFIGELIVRPLVEGVVFALFYWTGKPVLIALSLGTIRLAAFSTLGEKNRNKRKWYQLDWSIWLHPSSSSRLLKAECTCLVGFLTWVAVGILIYILSR